MKEFDYILYLNDNKLLKENHDQKFQVIFNYEHENFEPVKQLFNSEQEAKEWADAYEYDEQVESFDEDGNEYWKTQYRYFNPETKENGFTGYEIEPYNPINEINKKNDKAHKWNNLIEDEVKWNLLLSAVKDPEEAERFIELDWENLPDEIKQNINWKAELDENKFKNIIDQCLQEMSVTGGGEGFLTKYAFKKKK